MAQTDMAFELDTSFMDEAASSCQDLAEKMKTLKYDLEREKETLMWSWSGEGRNEFEKQFRRMLQQLSDVTESLWEMGEQILEAEEAYIQADTNAAKQLEGK